MATRSPAPSPAYAAAPHGDLRDHLGNLFDWRLRAGATGGALAIAEVLLQPGCEPPIHVHEHEDELFTVEEGEVTFVAGGRELRAGPGAVVFLPRGVAHGFRVETATARVRLLITPGGMERFMESWSEPVADRRLPPPPAHVDEAVLTASLAGYGVTVVGPPPAAPGWGAEATA